jgi:multicomponent Na+:H+ antiporter subunit E
MDCTLASICFGDALMQHYQRTFLMVRFVGFLFLWWVLSDGQLDQWWFGLGFVTLVIGVNYAMDRSKNLTAKPLRFMVLISLIPYFLYLSFKGGVSAARAALSIRPVQPYYTELPLRLAASDEAARTAFAASMCLLPGSLSCKIRADTLFLHVLDAEMLDIDSIRRYEKLIAALFAVPLADLS